MPSLFNYFLCKRFDCLHKWKKSLGCIIIVLFLIGQINNCIAQTNVSGNQGDSIWTKAKSPYILTRNVTVQQGKTLTIEPGVEVQFPRDTSQLTIKGTLNAEGSKSDSITFIGGTMPYKYGSYPKRGPIIIDATSTNSLLRYVKVDQLGYYGYPDNSAAIIIRSSSCTVSNCNIQNIHGSGINLDNAAPQIDNNAFTGNANADIVGIATVFKNIRNNVNASVYITPTTINQNASWPNPGTNARYILNGTITIDPSYNLNVAPGTTVDFNNNNGNIVVKGSLTAVGTATSKIGFIKQAAGTFFGGTLSFDSTSTGSSLAYVTTDGLGSTTSPAKSAAIELNTASINMVNVSIANSESNGLVLKKGSPTITQCNFLNNKTGVLSTSGKAVFKECGFVGNANFAINNTSSVVSYTVDARNNWWGATSGPKHPCNPLGTGDSVSDKVNFFPFNNQIIASLIPDIGVSALITPISSCNLTNAEPVKILVSNYSNVNVNNFSVNYRINNNLPVRETVTTLTVPAGSSVEYTFVTKAVPLQVLSPATVA